MKKVILIISFLLLSLFLNAQESNLSELPEISLEEIEIKEFTKQDLLDVFEKGPEAWNQFREENPDVDFKDYFSEQNFKDKNLKGINLSGMNLSGSSFINANLEGANLVDINLKSGNLFRANLRDANMENAILLLVNFNNSILIRANLKNAYISKVWKKTIENKNVSNLRNIHWR